MNAPTLRRWGVLSFPESPSASAFGGFSRLGFGVWGGTFHPFCGFRIGLGVLRPTRPFFVVFESALMCFDRPDRFLCCPSLTERLLTMNIFDSASMNTDRPVSVHLNNQENSMNDHMFTPAQNAARFAEGVERSTLDVLGARLDGLDARLDGLDDQLGRLGARVEALVLRCDEADDRLTEFAARHAVKHDLLTEFAASQVVSPVVAVFDDDDDDDDEVLSFDLPDDDEDDGYDDASDRRLWTCRDFDGAAPLVTASLPHPDVPGVVFDVRAASGVLLAEHECLSLAETLVSHVEGHRKARRTATFVDPRAMRRPVVFEMSGDGRDSAVAMCVTDAGGSFDDLLQVKVGSELVFLDADDAESLMMALQRWMNGNDDEGFDPTF